MGKFFLFLFALSAVFAEPDHAITYEKGSRFGDNLLTYLHAKWISYQRQIPFRYKPFKYSSKLVMHDREFRLSRDKKDRTISKIDVEPIDLEKTESTLYICPYFPEDPWELARVPCYRFEVDWKDPEFRKGVREMIQPKKRLRLVEPSKKTINIAIHVREGGGFDPESTKLDSPLKLPPLSFYAEGLSKIVALFPDKKILCHVFTDAVDPQKIVDVLKTAAPSGASVKFDYRKSKNRHDKNVIEDFFSLFNFDVLIRSQSNFSMIPALIHDYAIVYSPIGAKVEEGKVVIDQAELVMNEGLYQKLLLRKATPTRWMQHLRM
jgi:hypothetical protein